MKIKIPVDHHVARKLAEAGVEHDTRVSHVSVDADSYAHFLKRIATDYTHISSEEQHALAVSTCLTHPDHKHKQKPVRIPIEKVKVWPWHFWLIIVIVLMMALGFTTLARCQGTSQIDVITFKNAANTNVKSYAAPFTIKEGTGITFGAVGSMLTLNATGGGTGTVTSVSCGGLSPLFSCSVGTPTTTPSIAYTLSNAAAHTFFGNNTAGSAAPGFQAIGVGDLPGSGALTINTTAPLGGGGSVALGSSLTFTCTACLTSVTAHNLLSATHGDTTPSAAARGSIVTGQGVSPVWAQLTKGAANNVLKMDGSAVDVLWGSVDFSELTSIPQFAQSGNCTGTDKFSQYNASNGLFTCTADVGAATPTGTGFVHVTAGAQDGASKLVNLTAATDVAANQGTTTTVLHGNAAGQTAFGAVVQADVSGGYVDQTNNQGAVGGNKIYTGTSEAVSYKGTGTSLGPASAIAAVSGNPAVAVSNTGAGVDAKTYDFTATTTGHLQGRLINDAVNAATSWFDLLRSGQTVTSLALPEPVNVTGDTAITGKLSTTLDILAPNVLHAGPYSCVDPKHPAYGCKGDDATDDTACMRAAIAAVPHGGCLDLGPLTYLITCGTPVSNACLTLAYPIEFRGHSMNSESFGSVLRIPNTVANTVDALRLLSDANGDDGYYLHDFNIQCNAGPCARSGINIDTTSFPISRLTITRTAITGGFGAQGIRSTNGTPLVNGFFTSTIGPENLINNGILLQNAGDSIKISSNTIAFGSPVTSTAGINATFDVGAANFVVEKNNITQTKAGCIVLGAGALQPMLVDNFCEGGVSGTDVGSNGALIDIAGTTGSHVKGAYISGGIVQPVTTNINGIRVDFADSTMIGPGTTITRAGGTSVDVVTTANATNTNILPGIRYEPTTDVLANILTDAGTGTFYCLLPPQTVAPECNRGWNKTGQADIVADSAGINTTETIIVKTPALAANRLIAGTHVRMTLTGTCNASVANTSTFTVRMGTLGTTGDTAIATPVTSVSGTGAAAIPFKVVIEFTVRTVGASGTGAIELLAESNGLTGIIASQTPQIIFPTMSTFNTTTAANILSVSYKSAATTTTSTFKTATIEIVQN